MKMKTMDGNEACARSAYLFTELAGIYPITPSSTMAELTDEYSNGGKLNIFNMPVKVMEMQSEAGAAGLIHGALQNGVLATTFTASQGLLLMIPNMYKMAGEQLPAVIHVAARSLSTHALSIYGDHQDIYATRMTGFCMLSSSSVQSVMDMSAITHLSAIKSSMPFLHFFDGFRTSHEVQKIEVLEDINDLIDYEAIDKFKKRALSINKKVMGTAQDETVYFQNTEARNSDYNNVPDVVNYYMEAISNKTGREYKPFVYYGDSNATKIIIAMGSVCETIKETIDYMNASGEHVGMIEVFLYRPFSSKYFFNVLPKSVQKIAVLDRTKEQGSGEPLYLDVVNLFNSISSKPLIIGGRYGLSSKDTDNVQIKSIYDFLDNNPFNNFTVGICDDVTNLSIPLSDFKIEKESKEYLIYGFGSDGMVSASKDLLKIIGDNTDNMVQGYSQYDSKKSGSLTRCHLRISKNKIRSTYFVNSPSIVVCTKESYLHRYDMVSNIKDNGIFLFITSMNNEELNNSMPYEMKKILISKNISVYTIDAYKLAELNGIKNKISTIVEVCLLKLMNMDFDLIFNKIKESIKIRFLKKGEAVVQSNLKSIDDAISNLNKVELVQSDFIEESIKFKTDNKLFNMYNNLKGNELKVSDFMEHKDGSFEYDTTKYENKYIAESVPEWNKDLCIQCNQCSFVCPHAAIRPYLLNEDEYNNAPESIKAICKDSGNYKYVIGISKEFCTGCGLCVSTCPVKALSLKSIDLIVEENPYLKTVSEKKDMINNTIKGSQFSKPLFQYSGACAGCGETPYIKLLTQLFKERLVIANATGCSSIYGGSFPNIPYKLPWASSLFEDNAEFGYGLSIADSINRERLKKIIESNISKYDSENKLLLEKLLSNYEDYNISLDVYNNLDYSLLPEILPLKEHIIKKSVWMIGGDGWAYDIGFSGIDHVLSSNDNVNMLVLDTEVYSNTGGQSSKSSNKASVSKFTSKGKEASKKDLARIAMCYPNAYVAQISLGGNMQQAINAFVEAEAHDGPSIIIAYSPCTNHGIENSILQEKNAVKSGYFPIFRSNQKTGEFHLDYKEPDFNLFLDYLMSENRFKVLKIVNSEKADKLFEELKQEAIKRFEFYKKQSN